MKFNRKLVAFIGILLVLFLLNRHYGWSAYWGGEEGMAFLRERIQSDKGSAILLYIVFTVIGSVVLALPGITFAIAAGVLFGPWEGTFWCVTAVTLGAGFAFLAGRYFLRDSLKPVVMKNRHLKKWLFDEAGRNDFLVLMITRLVPLFPFNLQNFAYGITDITFSCYMLYTFLFIIPGTAMYTIGTAGIMDEENRIMYIIMALLLAVIVFLVSSFLKKRYMGKEDK